jgi:hypothetical protein
MEMDPIEDLKRISKPFLSTGIYEKTTNLVMQVIFADGLIPQNPKLKIFDDYVDRTPIYEEKLQFDATHKMLEYTVKYPIYHYRYMIEWRFDDHPNCKRNHTKAKNKP